MLNQFHYRLRQILIAKDMLIWGLLLPVVLLLIYSMVFRPISPDRLVLPTSRLALLSGRDEAMARFLAGLGAREESGDGRTAESEASEAAGKTQLRVSYTLFPSEEEARDALDAGAVDVVVQDAASGRYETRSKRSYEVMVAQQLLRAYQSVQKMEALASAHAPAGTSDAWPGSAATGLSANAPVLERLSIDTRLRSRGVDSMLSYQFACIAYIAFYAFAVGNHALDSIHAKQSPVGVREQISPLPRYKSFLSTFAAYALIYLLFTAFLYGLLRLLRVQAAMETPPLAFLLLLFVGQAQGFAVGTFCAALFPERKALRQAVGIALPLTLGFLSGMMAQPVANLILEKAPWLHAINPVSLVSRGIYGLYTQGAGPLFLRSLGSLAALFVVFLIMSMIALRKDRYASL